MTYTPIEPDPEIYETSYHGKIPGLFTNVIAKPEKTKGKYTFYYTGSSKTALLDGISIDLDLKMSPKTCSDYLLKQIKDKADTKDKQLIVYFPGGIPFISGTLADIFENKDLKVNKVIYGVLTRPVKEEILNKPYLEICNVNDPNLRSLISPFCDSSDRGLSDMACLLGYLNHDGIKGDLLRRTCATVIHFPPLITSMTKIINRAQLVGRDIVTVTSTLYTFFRAYLPRTCHDKNVYEYGLRLCNLISHIPEPPEKLPIMPIQVKPDEKSTKFLSDLKLGPLVYFWKGDTGEDYCWTNFDIQGSAAIESAYNLIASFTPIAPLSMRVVSGCSIVRGKDHEYLYLMQSPSKDTKSQNKVDIIDPMTGMTESKDIELFAQEQGNTKADDVANLIDPDRVKQIIMVNFDESKSMTGDLEGYEIPKNSRLCSRVTIAIQYLTSFANRAYGYRIPCIQGLASFNNKITLRCPLSPLVPDFENKGLKGIKPNSTTKLWDSLLYSCQEIVNFRKDEKGNDKYPEAVSRILVISDGEDVDSKAKVEDVVKELIKNKIIVDSVIINTEEGCKMLCAVCHATGGLAFRPENIDEGIELFEQSAFLNYEERKLSLESLVPKKRVRSRDLKPDMITAELMNEIKDNSQFDEYVKNKEITIASTNARLATPLHVCSENANVEIPSPRQRRILRELHTAAQLNDSKSADYDPDLKVYPYQANLDRWRVFIKAPEGTPYSGKWWYIYVTFPDLYPAEPPIFRFVTIPYHLNVSQEGRICLNIIEKGYISSKHVVEILQEIKELFLLPNTDTPVEIKIYNIFLNNPDRYQRFARNSTNDNAKDDYKDYIKDVYIDDSVNPKFTLDFEKHIPPYMRSQISGREIPPERRVISSTGVIYDREELKQLISSNRNPICVVTGEPLTEKLEDLEDDAI